MKQGVDCKENEKIPTERENGDRGLSGGIWGADERLLLVANQQYLQISCHCWPSFLDDTGIPL